MINPMWMAPAFDAVILAGGAGRRLGGVDKALIEVDGATLLDRALSACHSAGRTVVVGPRRADVAESVVWCREDPPGGGPVAGLAAGLLEASADVVVVLAVDQPWIAGGVPALRASLAAGNQARPDSVDAAVLVDADGRRNYLAAAWRRIALLNALLAIDQLAGASMRSVYASARCVEVRDGAGWGRDIDTPDDLRGAN
jgi:molybdopterin-guanine dinucleotide biosynthesis protein A